MPALVRSSAPRGPKFYDDAGKIMFINVLDATTRFGPMEATTDHIGEHPEAWATYEAGAKDEREAFPPPVVFSTPEDASVPDAPKAKGQKAPA